MTGVRPGPLGEGLGVAEAAHFLQLGRVALGPGGHDGKTKDLTVPPITPLRPPQALQSPGRRRHFAVRHGCSPSRRARPCR
jgi:hypothetical protein